MRLFLRICVAGVLVSAFTGCGGPSVEEGIPKNIDMTKDYAPKVEMPGMSPKQSKEANTAAKKAVSAPTK